ncbi:MAG: hypothetical protein V7K47_04705 [Nostoc sp.]
MNTIWMDGGYRGEEFMRCQAISMIFNNILLLMFLDINEGIKNRAKQAQYHVEPFIFN